MFDNFGLGEFMTIAIFALLFFGPERLPQMGAKLGQWLGKLTQQSKLFMYQWREEALAIHGAVEEVKGIRDEIMAARNEIANTMTSAQGDIAQSLDDVKGSLKNSRVTYEKMVSAAEAEQHAKQAAEVAKQASGEDEAIVKSQAIVANMQAQLGDISLELRHPQVVALQDGKQVTLPTGEPQPESDAAKPDDAETKHVPQEQPKPGAHEQTQQILAAMQRQLSGEPVEADKPVGEKEIVADTAESPQASDEQAQSGEKERVSTSEVLQQVPGSPLSVGKVAKRTGPSAYEQTQSILDRMQRQLAGEPVEPLDAPASEVKEAAEQEAQDEWTQKRDMIHEMLAKSQPKQQASGEKPAESTIRRGEQIQQVVSDNGPDDKLRELSGQVSTLQSEIKSLRQALDALRAEMLIKTALPARMPTRAAEDKI